MILKRLEIYGFKSFADKTVIDFNSGITGIVGPNGSGKSNFSDAIKWVLGEQSAKSLRGKDMKDVIFTGTERRTKMSYCEVSLVFDNTDHQVFKTLDFDEVTISRKLYRSGNSEYLINNVTCRLADIKNLIRDTGLGKEGYSIIGQGRVEEIINSKAEDRRVIFEEAAGISKYKKKKNESESKLEKTREHLDRLQDIIREIERRLSPLEKQAENTRKYNQLYDELRSLEVNHYLFACDNKDISLAKINDIIKGISEQIAKIEFDISTDEKLYDDANYNLRRCEEELAQYNEQRTQLLVDNQKRLGYGEVLTERLATLKNEKNRLNDNIVRYQKTVEENIALSEKLKSELAELILASKKLESDYQINQDKYDKILSEINEKESEFENSDKAIREAFEKLADVKADSTKLVTELAFLQDKKSELEETITRLKASITKEEAEKTQIEKLINGLQDELTASYSKLKKSKTRFNEIKLEQDLTEKNITELKGSISAYETKLKIMIDAKNHYDSYQGPVKRIMQYAKQDSMLDSKILGVVAELIKVPTKYEVAIEVALGGALQNIVTPTLDDVKYCIDILRRERMGIITFLPVNSMRPRNLSPEQRAVLNEAGCEGVANELIKFDRAYQNIFSNLLGGTVICDTYDNAIKIAKKYNRAFRIVTLQGDVLSTQGSVTGGSRKNDSLGILSQERDIADVEQKLANCKKNLTENTTKLAELHKEVAILNENVKTSEETLRDKDVEIGKKTTEFNMIEDKLDSYITELGDITDKYEILCDKLDIISERLSGTDKAEQDIEITRISIDDAKSKSRELLNNRKSEREQILAVINQIRLDIADNESKREKINEDILQADKQVADARKLIIEDQNVITTLISSIADTEHQINSAELSEKDKQKLAEIEDMIKTLQGKKVELSATLTGLIEQKDVNMKALQSANEKKLKEENNIDKINVQFETLAERIKEEYGLDHAGAVLYRIDDFNDSNVTTLIANNKRAITSLGAINPTALQEFEEESERYNVLTTQRDDVMKSEADLLDIINEISQEMTEIFDYEFAKISKNFEVTFKELFGGGSGQLVVDKDAEDPLEAGIDIIAAPPGKKPGNLASLSGGEKALTAMAILFAILKSKPMPFCILDEMEAALDETNVAVFAKYLKKFVTGTQFIVITHRKPTMEQVDRLYGVTMEEKGVSKVVSVELGEAVKHAMKK